MGNGRPREVNTPKSCTLILWCRSPSDTVVCEMTHCGIECGRRKIDGLTDHRSQTKKVWYVLHRYE